MNRFFLLLCGLSLAAHATASPTWAGIITFGSGVDAFGIDFVEIGSPGNAADRTGNPALAGAVTYTFNIAKYEISRDMIAKANAVGGLGLTLADMTSLGGNGDHRPATGLSWYEAAKFVNWLNTSKGYEAAYNFDANGNFQLWDLGDSWSHSLRGTNRFRNKRAYFWLPSVDEWYKAAYYDPASGNWNDFPSSDGSVPTPVASGTADKTAVYNQPLLQGPADIDEAGGPSAFGVVGLGGNVWEWEESAWDLSNDNPLEFRGVRGGAWLKYSLRSGYLSSSDRSPLLIGPAYVSRGIGFRVTSVSVSSSAIPEPRSVAIWSLLGAGASACGRKKRTKRR